MNEIKIVNEKGSFLVLGDGQDYALTNINGLNPPKANINTSAIAGFDGSTYISANVSPRNIVLTLELRGDIEENRLKLYDVFKIKRRIQFYYNSPLIDVNIGAYVESLEVPPMARPVTAIISLLCPQPYFESLEEIIEDIASIETRLQWPLALASAGIELGTLHPSQAVNIFNPGDIPIGMIVKYRANGVVVNPKLINTQTLEFIELNTTLASGDILTLTTEVGYKRIERNRNGTITNEFNAMVVGSKFIQLSEGDNVLYATAVSGSASLSTQIQYRPKYAGV